MQRRGSDSHHRLHRTVMDQSRHGWKTTDSIGFLPENKTGKMGTKTSWLKEEVPQKTRACEDFSREADFNLALSLGVLFVWVRQNSSPPSTALAPASGLMSHVRANLMKSGCMAVSSDHSNRRCSSLPFSFLEFQTVWVFELQRKTS